MTTLLTQLPALSAELRAAFRSQFSDADCAALGAKTKSAAVRDGAMSWAGDAARALPRTDDAPSEIDYAPSRLAWLVEQIAVLDAARADAGRSGGQQSGLRSERDVGRAKAKAVRHRLASKLSRVVKGDAVVSAALSDAGSAPDDRALGESLRALGALAQRVTSGSDARLAILARAARVTPADATAATQVADALLAARGDVALGGRAHGDRDTAAVNLVEGRVLHEMILLRDAFAEARTRGVAVPAMVPSSGLRTVLARLHHAKAAPAPAPGPAAQPN